ncbi:MAG: hypothetical protein ACLVAE_09060 [Evtepia gabavorous]|uniref:hypothetical protein n=1 Tax=Evtepia gabavorous TaxID=2211183 RepID=UPI003999CFEF
MNAVELWKIENGELTRATRHPAPQTSGKLFRSFIGFSDFLIYFTTFCALSPLFPGAPRHV